MVKLSKHTVLKDTTFMNAFGSLGVSGDGKNTKISYWEEFILLITTFFGKNIKISLH